ncbi:MAG: hypothetical protein GF344_03740 [Chitinivibrionales bacterium]|nr:hypothetical protein [Chitinivibrionales bacterium]
MINLEEQKSIVKQSITGFLSEAFPNDDLQAILNDKVKDYDSFRNHVADILIEEFEKLRSDNNDSTYTKVLSSNRICDQNHIAVLIRKSVVERWNNLSDDAFEGTRENEDGSLAEDFATFMSERIADFLQTQPDSKYLDYLKGKKRAQNKFLWYWLDGLIITLKLGIISIISSFVALIICFGVKFYAMQPNASLGGLIMVIVPTAAVAIFILPLVTNLLVDLLGIRAAKSEI